jgi:biotin carboxyl carrier protein
VAISRRAAAATKQPRSKSCSPTHVPRSELEEALETLTTANLRLEKENFHLRKKRICRDFKTLMDKLRKVLKNLKNLQKEKEKPKLRDLRRLRATGVRFTTQQPSSAVAPAAGTDPQHVAAPAAPATPTVTPTDDKEILDNENQKLCARSLATITDLVDNVSVLVEALKLSPTLWWDYNKTRMEKEVIEAEARKLERENKVLREDFRKAMETITAMRKQGYGGTMRGDATGDAQQQQANNKNATLKPRGPMTISQESGEHQNDERQR